MLIEGAEGTGRSILSQRLCYGFLKNGASVTYVSTEMTYRDFIDQMYSLNYPVGPYMMSRKLNYFPVYPILGQQKEKRDDFVEKLTISPQLYTNDILIIDNLSGLMNGSFSEAMCLKLMGFFKKFSGRDKTIILTIDDNVRSLDPIRSAADIYITLSMKPGGDGIKRFIEVKRYTRAKGKVDEFLKYRIEPGQGMVIEITEVSG